jgi:hypothetical protein
MRAGSECLSFRRRCTGGGGTTLPPGRSEYLGSGRGRSAAVSWLRCNCGLTDGVENRRDADEIEGRYANSFNIGFNDLEFLIEIGQHYSEGGPARVHTRIITSPAYAKSFSELLHDAVERYERQFGVI